MRATPRGALASPDSQRTAVGWDTPTKCDSSERERPNRARSCAIWLGSIDQMITQLINIVKYLSGINTRFQLKNGFLVWNPNKIPNDCSPSGAYRTTYHSPRPPPSARSATTNARCPPSAPSVAPMSPHPQIPRTPRCVVHPPHAPRLHHHLLRAVARDSPDRGGDAEGCSVGGGVPRGAAFANQVLTVPASRREGGRPPCGGLDPCRTTDLRKKRW